MVVHVLSTLNCTVQISRDLHCKQALSFPTPITELSSLPGERSSPWISLHFLSLRKEQGHMGHGRRGGIFIVAEIQREKKRKWSKHEEQVLQIQSVVNLHTVLIIICAGSFLDHCQFHSPTTTRWTTMVVDHLDLKKAFQQKLMFPTLLPVVSFFLYQCLCWKNSNSKFVKLPSPLCLE